MALSRSGSSWRSGRRRYGTAPSFRWPATRPGRPASGFRAFLLDKAAEPGPIAVCTHGGVTLDLLRTLLGDQALAPGLLADGIPCCAITTLADLAVLDIASVSHPG